jgi:WD40 repeat protein
MKKQYSKKAAIAGEYVLKSGYKINCAAIGSNSCEVFCSGDDYKNVCLWTLNSQMPIKVLSGHSSEVSSVLFSKDEKTLYSGTEGGSIYKWDIQAQKIVSSFKEHRNSCTCLSVPESPSAELLMSGSQDTNVKVWDLKSGKSIYTFKFHDGPVNCVKFSPSNQWVASGGNDGTIKVMISQFSHSRLFPCKQAKL